MSTYTVQAGDTLSSIARRELGNALAWPDIWGSQPADRESGIDLPGPGARAPAAPSGAGALMRELTHEGWLAEAEQRFGPDAMDWKFVCPSCGHVTAVRDWKAAGASEGQVAFSCVGRNLGADDARTFRNQGGPCQYAGGGLFGLNPVRVTLADGKVRDTFEFAPEEAAVAVAVTWR